MKRMLSLAVLLLLAAGARAQDVDTLWVRHFGGVGAEDGAAVARTADGGFLVGGSTTSFGAGGMDFYLVRLDSLGDTLWTRGHGQADDEICTAVALRADGTFLAAGYRFNSAAGHWAIHVLTVNDAGSVVGETVAGSTTADWFAYDLELTADGGYALAGSVEDTTGARLLLRRFRPDGTLQFETQITANYAASGRTLEELPDGGFIIGGLTRAGNIVDPPSDFLLVRTDPAGLVLWTRTWGTPDRSDAIQDLVLTPDGGFAVTGPTEAFSDESDFYLARLNAIGDTLWTHRYGGPMGDQAHALAAAPGGGFALAGRSASFGAGGELFVVRTDSAGGELWSRSFGSAGSEIGKTIQAMPEGGFIVAGTTTSFGAGDSNVYVLRLIPLEQTAAPERPAGVSGYRLAQNYPNPFNPETRISFTLPRREAVRLRIFDVTGRDVTTLLSGELAAGEHSVAFDGRGLSAGTYFCELRTAGFAEVRKMLLVK